MLKVLLVIPKITNGDEIFNMIDRNRSELNRWLPWVNAMKTNADEIRFIQESLRDKTKLTFAIEIDESIVGMIDLHDIKGGTAEVGYWLDKNFVGKGVASAALRNLEITAERDHGIKKLKVILNVNNGKSMHVAKRNNYQFIKQNGENLIFEKELGKF